jgi:hypothetical protein
MDARGCHITIRYTPLLRIPTQNRYYKRHYFVYFQNILSKRFSLFAKIQINPALILFYKQK